MESVEVSAKTVDEAIDIALEELGLKRNQVDIEILTPGKPGLFGLGGEQARVRVTALEGVEVQRREPESESETRTQEELFPESEIEVKDISSEEVELASDYLRTLLDLMGIDAEVSVRAPETPADGLGRATAVLDIDGEDLGLLIGRRGSSLAALQYLVNVMVTRRLGSRVLVTIDVEHYHRRREDSLRGLARRMADRVRQSRRPVTLEPMPAAERRIIHLALSEDQAVMTASVGQGDERKVVIRPRSGGGDRPDGGGYGRRGGGGGYQPRR
jgi:spoIIIJ-associated protein